MKGHRGRMGNMWISGVPANALRHLGIHRQLAGGRESGEVCARHTHTHALHLSLSECHKLGTQPREIWVFVGLEHVYVSKREKGNNLLQLKRGWLQKPAEEWCQMFVDVCYVSMVLMICSLNCLICAIRQYGHKIYIFFLFINQTHHILTQID